MELSNAKNRCRVLVVGSHWYRLISVRWDLSNDFANCVNSFYLEITVLLAFLLAS